MVVLAGVMCYMSLSSEMIRNEAAVLSFSLDVVGNY